MRLVVVALDAEEYGLPIDHVQEIIRHTEPRDIPSTAAAVRGVITLRSRIIPVCDLAAHLGVRGGAGGDRRIVIVESGGQRVGLIVDAVTEVMTRRRDVDRPGHGVPGRAAERHREGR